MAEAGELTHLGPYRIQSRLGGGAMGAVYRAVHETLERPVALKILPDELAASEEFIARFLREAKAAAALRHPHVVDVFDAGFDQGKYFIAMELVEGRSLGDLLKERGSLDEAEGLRLLREAADGLSAAHAKGMVHRDIKPDNILLEHERTVRIVDFGLVRDIANAKKLTVTGAMLGTPAYISPEQAGGEPAEERSDLYSLGCTFFRAMTGHPVFISASSMNLLYKHRYEKPPDPRTYNPKLSENTANLLLTLLAKKAVDRPASAKTVCEMIDAIRGGGKVPRPAWLDAALPSPEALAPTVRTKTKGARPAWLLPSAVAVATVLGLVAWLALREPALEPAPLVTEPQHPQPAAPDSAELPAPPPALPLELSAEEREEFAEYMEVGQWALELGKFRQARANFLLALRLSPGHAPAVEGLRKVEEGLKTAF